MCNLPHPPPNYSQSLALLSGLRSVPEVTLGAQTVQLLKARSSAPCVNWAQQEKSEEPTFSGHADVEALLEPTVLTAVPTERRDLTLLIVTAAVVHPLRDAATEEPLERRNTRLE